MFKDELQALQERLDLRVVHVLKDPPTGWEGESGYITPALLHKTLPKDALKYEYFLCGPKAMSNSVQQELHKLHVPFVQIHFELFDMV